MDQFTKAKFLLEDKAYDADEHMRDKLEEKKCTAVIPSKQNLLCPID